MSGIKSVGATREAVKTKNESYSDQLGWAHNPLPKLEAFKRGVFVESFLPNVRQ